MLCVCMSVCEPTAPSMSHFKVLSLSASWHLLTPTIIMLIYIVWLHKVIYAQFYSMAAQGCVLLLLNALKRTFHDHLTPFMVASSFSLRMFCLLSLSTLVLTLSIKSVQDLAKIWRPLPTGKIIAKITNWAMLICSWRDDELRSLSSQSSLATYRKDVFCVESGGQEMSSLPHLFTASGVIRNAEGC